MRFEYWQWGGKKHVLAVWGNGAKVPAFLEMWKALIRGS